MHLKSITTFLAKKLLQMHKNIRSTKGQHTGICICGVQTQRRSHQWPSSGDIWMRACNVWLPQRPSYSMNLWCISANNGFPNLAIIAKFWPLPQQNDRLWFCLPCIYLAAKSVNGDATGARHQEWFADKETCGDRIPYRTRGTVARQEVANLADQPLCSDELDEQSSSSPVVWVLACNSAGRWDRPGSLRTWCGEPSCYSFWNLVNAMRKNSASLWGILGDELDWM